MEKNPAKCSVFVISAPSGAGKSSLVNALCKLDSKIRVSISHTTRIPRTGETNGIEYYFSNETQFKLDLEHKKFLEHAKVFGNYYGTQVKTISNLINSGYDTVLEIDWQGARQVKQIMPEAVLIFILPPSIDALKSRLKSRNTDSEEVMQGRLNQAEEDISHAKEFDHVIVNDNFDVALQDLYSIIRSYRLTRD